MKLAAWPVQVALKNALTTAGVTIKDEVTSSGQSFPYATFGEVSVTHLGTKTNNVQSVRVNIDCWAQYNGTLQIHDLAEDVIDAIDSATLSVTGWHLAGVELAVECYTAAPVPDYNLRRGTVIFDVTATEV